ncbi:MAG TPA: hypothetical protein VEH86_00075 [Candidatus Acidoferrum sp.]|nr:hypothetical protein [Candidatus Acidoferrum sp.]
MDEFDKHLVKTIDKTFKYVLGDQNTLIIYDYLEKASCPIGETPKKLYLFSRALRNLLGTGKGQILGVPAVLEDAIVDTLSSELGLKLDGKSRVFEVRIRRLKEKYNNGHCQKARG